MRAQISFASAADTARRDRTCDNDGKKTHEHTPCHENKRVTGPLPAPADWFSCLYLKRRRVLVHGIRRSHQKVHCGRLARIPTVVPSSTSRQVTSIDATWASLPAWTTAPSNAADLDGRTQVIVPPAAVSQPKHPSRDGSNGNLYCSDSRRDASHAARAPRRVKIETHRPDGRSRRLPPRQTRWCVGIAVDLHRDRSTGPKMRTTPRLGRILARYRCP